MSAAQWKRQQAMAMSRMRRQTTPLPPSQPVEIPSEYVPPPAAAAPVAAARPPTPVPTTTTMVTSGSAALESRVETVCAEVATLSKQRFQVVATPKATLPVYRTVPQTVEELKRQTEHVDGDDVLLSHPHIIGAGGVVFMLLLRCDAVTGAITERYLPIGLSRKWAEASHIFDTVGEGETVFVDNFRFAM